MRARHHFFQLISTLPAEVSLILCSHRLDELTCVAPANASPDAPDSRLVRHVVAMAEGRIDFDGEAAKYVAAMEAELSALDLQRGPS